MCTCVVCRMDIEQTDAIAIGVDELLREYLNDRISLTNPATTIDEQGNTLKSENCQLKAFKEGDCHIFNYQEFDSQSERKGSNKDAARLKHDFTQLNLNVHLHENLTYVETFNILIEASRKTYDTHNSKYFICCFLTHGNQTILWAKDKEMDIDDILLEFSKSPALKKIPKIFIIQACRGPDAEEGVSTESTDSGSLSDTERYLDFLIVNSTYFNTVSYRATYEEKEINHGSYFIDEFCRSLEQFSSELDLVQILTIVNYRMANIFLSKHVSIPKLDGKKQMPCFVSTLRKKVEFNKNIEPYASSDTEYFNKRREKSRFGPDCTDFLRNSNMYTIKKSKNVLYLSIINEQIKNAGLNVSRAVDNSLWATFAHKDYSREYFQGKIRRSKILEFLNQSSNQAKGTSEVDCLICYIAAYSRHDFVCDADGRKISKKDIVDKFIGQLNESFVAKPKIFIFLLYKLNDTQTIPDEKFCEDVEPASESDINTNSAFVEFPGSVQETHSRSRRFNSGGSESTDGGRIKSNLIPVHADILEVSITVRDWKRVIGPIGLLSKMLKDKSNSTDLLSLFTEFNRELVEKHNFFDVSKKIHGTSSSFSVTSTLTKLLYLP